MSERLKVRALEKLYYIDALYGPGVYSMIGGEKQDLSVFTLASRRDFNPNLMEAIGWEPDNKEADPARVKDDGSHRTTEEMLNIASDKLDEGLRQARQAKAESDQEGFISKVKTPVASPERL